MYIIQFIIFVWFSIFSIVIVDFFLGLIIKETSENQSITIEGKETRIVKSKNSTKTDLEKKNVFDKKYFDNIKNKPINQTSQVEKIIGEEGEERVNSIMKKYLDHNIYTLIENITLPYIKTTTQIDHIIVSEYGIFIIETKNMKGWIFGSENDKKWTQSLKNINYQFNNPLSQNRKHIKIIKELTKITDKEIHSIILFVGDSKFKTNLPENVMTDKELINYIISKNQKLLTSRQKINFIKKIEKLRLSRSEKTDLLHIKNIKDDNCPYCGSRMVIRKSKKTSNKFWGCSTFPKCRGRKNY